MNGKMMRKLMSGRTLVFGLLLLLCTATSSDAFHFFRGDDAGGCGSGCCPASGEIGEQSANIGATVLVLHNSYNDEGTLLPLVVRITAGQAVQWKWASSHCHSVTSDTAGQFESGFFYPTDPPAGQMEVVHGFLDYPLPDPNPSLTYTHTFTTPGQYLYHCIHHQVIGMEGVVIVDPY